MKLATSLLIGLMIVLLTVPAVLGQESQEPVGGIVTVRIPSGGSRELMEVIDPTKSVCGACDLVFVYRLIEPTGMQMPKNIFVQRFVHQMGYQRPEPLTSGYYSLLTSGHGGFQILNKSGRTITLEVKYAGWQWTH